MNTHSPYDALFVSGANNSTGVITRLLLANECTTGIYWHPYGVSLAISSRALSQPQQQQTGTQLDSCRACHYDGCVGGFFRCSDSIQRTLVPLMPEVGSTEVK